MVLNADYLFYLRSRCIALLMAVALVGGSYGWIQGIAWVGMTVKGIQQYQSITQALGKTFDGTSPCGLCEAIEQHQSESDGGSELFSAQKQKEIPVELARILILPDRPELGKRQDPVQRFSLITDCPDIPPPRNG